MVGQNVNKSPIRRAFVFNQLPGERKDLRLKGVLWIETVTANKIIVQGSRFTSSINQAAPKKLWQLEAGNR